MNGGINLVVGVGFLLMGLILGILGLENWHKLVGPDKPDFIAFVSLNFMFGVWFLIHVIEDVYDHMTRWLFSVLLECGILIPLVVSATIEIVHKPAVQPVFNMSWWIFVIIWFFSTIGLNAIRVSELVRELGGPDDEIW